jgi:hypothetical protein
LSRYCTIVAPKQVSGVGTVWMTRSGFTSFNGSFHDSHKVFVTQDSWC